MTTEIKLYFLIAFEQYIFTKHTVETQHIVYFYKITQEIMNRF